MPVEIEPLLETKQNIQKDYELASGQTLKDGVYFTTITASVKAAYSKIQGLKIVKALTDLFLSKTTSVESLEEYSLYTKRGRQPATAAILNVIGPGTPNAILEGGVSGNRFVHANGENFYFTTSVTVDTNGDFTAQVAAFNSGINANIATGTLSLASGGSPDILGDLTILNIAQVGNEQESIIDWRENQLRKARRPVLPDNYSYFYDLARERPPIIAGYPYADDPSVLHLYLETNNTITSGVPTDEQMTDFLAYVNGDLDGVLRLPTNYVGKAPDGVTDRFQIFKSEPTEFYLRITGITGDSIRETITTQLKRLVFDVKKPYIKGVSIENNGSITTRELDATVLRILLLNGSIGWSGDWTGNVVLTRASDDVVFDSYPLGRGERARLRDATPIIWG